MQGLLGRGLLPRRLLDQRQFMLGFHACHVLPTVRALQQQQPESGCMASMFMGNMTLRET